MNVKNFLKTAFLPAACFLLLNSFACGGNKQMRVTDDDALKQKDSVKYGTVRALLASVQAGPELVKVSPSKVDAAFELAANVSEYYRLIPSSQRDSLVNVLKNEGKQPTAIAMANLLKPERLFFARVNAFKNLLRVELISRRPPDFSTETRGVGYAILRYRVQDSAGTILYDPTILEAMQRAMIAVEGKSDMFLKSDGKLHVEPAETIVVGGIDFQDNGIRQKWELFEDKVVNSYDAVETIFNLLKDNPRYVAIDTDTRDSMLAANNMYMVENYNPATKQEIEALDRFEVKKYITGVLKRMSPSDAELTMNLCAIENGNLTIIKTEKAALKEDSILKFREAIEATMRKLLQ